MPAYDVVFDKNERASSDAAVGTKPTATSQITGPLEQALVVRVTAASEADARAAVGVTYSGDVSQATVVPVANWTEA